MEIKSFKTFQPFHRPKRERNWGGGQAHLAVLVNLMIILELKEKPAVIFAKVPPVGRCAKQLTSVNVAEPVINVVTLRLNATHNIKYS